MVFRLEYRSAYIPADKAASNAPNSRIAAITPISKVGESNAVIVDSFCECSKLNYGGRADDGKLAELR